MRLSDESEIILKLPKDKTATIAWSLERQELAVGKSDGAVISIYGQQETKYPNPHTDEISAISWTKGGNTLATASRDKSINLWRDGNLITSLMGHKTVIYGLSWNNDSDLLASCSGDKTGAIWNNDGLQSRLTGHEGAVTIIEWNPEGTIIATGSADKTVRLWNSEGSAEKTLKHNGALASMRWNPNQKDLLATGSYDKTIQLWYDGVSVALLKGHRDRVFGIDWSRDGKYLASSSGFKDGEIIIWDDSGEKITSFDDHTSSVYQVSWNPTNNQLASASFDGTARVWNMDGEQAVLRHPGPVFAAKWSKNGNLLATAGMGIVAIWDTSKFC